MGIDTSQYRQRIGTFHCVSGRLSSASESNYPGCIHPLPDDNILFDDICGKDHTENDLRAKQDYFAYIWLVKAIVCNRYTNGKLYNVIFHDDIPGMDTTENCIYTFQLGESQTNNNATQSQTLYIASKWLVLSLCANYMKGLLLLAGDIEKNPGPLTLYTDRSNTEHANQTVIRKGVFHQGSPVFIQKLMCYGVANSCMANSLAALCYSFISPPNLWHCDDIDNVLEIGTTLYGPLYQNRQVKDNSSCLFFADLETTFLIGTDRFTCKPETTYFGVMDEHSDVTLSLEDAIRQAFQVSRNCIIIVKDSGMALFCKDDGFYLYDPHSRDNNGLCHSDGAAILCITDSIKALCTHLRCLTHTLTSAEMNVVPFEIAPLQIEMCSPKSVENTPNQVNVIHPEKGETSETMTKECASGKIEGKERTDFDVGQTSERRIQTSETLQYPRNPSKVPTQTKKSTQTNKKQHIENKQVRFEVSPAQCLQQISKRPSLKRSCNADKLSQPVLMPTKKKKVPTATLR